MKLIASTILALSATMASGQDLAQELDPNRVPSFMAKPVYCGDIRDLIPIWDNLNMYPLVMGVGTSWGRDSNPIPSITFMVVNNEGEFAFFEQTPYNSCLLSTGNMVEYSSENIKQVLGW